MSTTFVREEDQKFLRLTKLVPYAGGGQPPAEQPWRPAVREIQSITGYDESPVYIELYESTTGEHVKESIAEVDQQLVDLGLMAPERSTTNDTINRPEVRVHLIEQERGQEKVQGQLPVPPDLLRTTFRSCKDYGDPEIVARADGNGHLVGEDVVDGVITSEGWFEFTTKRVPMIKRTWRIEY